jgi:spore maturation protein CgeB
VLRILYIGMRYDYGDPRRGDCYEYVNFYDTLRQMEGLEVTHFPYDTILREVGRKAMNKRLLRTVEDVAPDVCFFILFTDEITKETIERISRRSSTLTVNWFTDDHWRFASYSRHWAPAFNFVATTDAVAAEKYRQHGIETAILTQWGFNPFRYQAKALPCDGRVTFVGQRHSHRGDLVGRLVAAGIPVEAWGRGWANGRLEFDEMVSLFSRSAINLNFSESSIVVNTKQLAKVLLNRRADDTYQVHGPRRVAENLRMLLSPHPLQIKARVFEIPGCGGFMVTETAEDLERYFLPGKEIAVFQTPDAMVELVRHYLAHDEEREQMRIAGYQRAVREHSYVHRFRDIFQKMGVYEKVQ